MKINDLSRLFGARLREARISRKMTQVKLSKVTGLHDTAISHYERGKRYPNIDHLMILAVGLNATTDYLVGLCHDDVLVDYGAKDGGAEKSV